MAFGSEPLPAGVYNFTAGPGRKNEAPIQGPTVYSEDTQPKTSLRPIAIDGSNIAYAHGRGSHFSGLLFSFFSSSHQTYITNYSMALLS